MSIEIRIFSGARTEDSRFSFFFFFFFGYAMMWCHFYTSKSSAEGQILAKESTVLCMYLVQLLGVGERNMKT